jgi:hypothetical protein
MSIRFAGLKISLVVAEIAWAAPSRADAPAQMCVPSLITCAENEVGKSCPSGGQCESVFCRADGSAMTVYRCMSNDAGTTNAPDHDLTAGGCDVAAHAAGPGAIALVLLLAGALMLFADRRRKADR